MDPLRAIVVAALVALVAWVRMGSFALGGVERLAEERVGDRLVAHVAPEVSRDLAPDEWRRAVEAKLQAWIAAHPERHAEAKSAVAEAFREELTYVGEDGVRRPYLGDLDSYAWLRQARTYLRTGTICDEVAAGECRDAMTLAPVGSRMPYPRSLHVAAIVTLHRTIELFRSGWPLAASAMLVPVIVGALGVLPAFGIGRRLAGPVGGVFAALVSALHRPLLLRSSGSDNDVWNVFLPLVMVWAAIAALEAETRARRIGLAAAAGLAAGIHAATWGGWIVTAAIVVTGILGGAVLDVLARVVGRAGKGGSGGADPFVPATVLAVGAVVCTVTAFALGADGSTFSPPSIGLGGAATAEVAAAPLAPLSDRDLWPDAFETVAEAARTEPGSALRALGGPVLALLGLIGLGWLIGDLVRGVPGRAGRAPALIVVLWLCAAGFLAPRAERYLLFLGPPLAMLVAVAVGRAHDRLLSAPLTVKEKGTLPFPAEKGSVPFSLAAAAAWAGIALVFALPLRDGIRTASGYLPLLDDAWFSALTRLRDGSAPEAIVNASWEYGYWVKHLAERRTSADGASLRTHAPVWLDRALASGDERESAGTLRMLACGSDATPYPEGAAGAYGKLRARGQDPYAAVDLVLGLLRLDARAAEARLAGLGLDAEASTKILGATHCDLPEVYWVLSTRQRETSAMWLRTGTWNFQRAYIRHRAAHGPRAAAVAELGRRFGIGAPAAERSLAEADALGRDFVVPSAAVEWRYVAQRPFGSAGWQSCQAEGPRLRCPLALVDDRAGTTVREVVYDGDAPERSMIAFEPGAALEVRGRVESPPGALFVADGAGFRPVEVPASSLPELGVLIDVVRKRVLTGTASYLRSTFVQLAYLDGRYVTRFEKTAERETLTGERVQTWRVRWP